MNRVELLEADCMKLAEAVILLTEQAKKPLAADVGDDGAPPPSIP